MVFLVDGVVCQVDESVLLARDAVVGRSRVLGRCEPDQALVVHVDAQRV